MRLSWIVFRELSLYSTVPLELSTVNVRLLESVIDQSKHGSHSKFYLTHLNLIFFSYSLAPCDTSTCLNGGVCFTDYPFQKATTQCMCPPLYANYNGHTNCIDNVIPNYVGWSDSGAIAVMFLSILSLLLTIGVGVLIVMARKVPAIKASWMNVREFFKPTLVAWTNYCATISHFTFGK